MKTWAKSRFLMLMAFLCPVIAGLCFMAYAGAPKAKVFANAVAALCVAILFLLAPQSYQRVPFRTAAPIALVVLAATFLGPAIGDTHRWLSIGPLTLHAAMLLLPLLATQILGQDRRFIFAIAALVALIFAFQPDRASAITLFFLSLCWFCFVRDRWALATLAATGCALGRTMSTADSLLPVRFVENVVGDAASIHVGIAVVLIGTILVAIAVPLYAVRKSRLANVAPLAAWSICLAGYFLASLVGPYPTPLLGYGVSPILGFGLALAIAYQKSGKTI